MSHTDPDKPFVSSLEEAVSIAPIPPNLASRIATMGDVEIELYAPKGADGQRPHTRDELYIVARGTAVFSSADGERSVAPGDLIYVPAHEEHRFTRFSPDVAFWVMFFGSEK